MGLDALANLGSFSSSSSATIKPTKQLIGQLPPVQSNQSLSTVDETADVVEIEKYCGCISVVKSIQEQTWNGTLRNILDEVGESDEQECLVYKRKVEQAAKFRTELLQILSDANANFPDDVREHRLKEMAEKASGGGGSVGVGVGEAEQEEKKET
ncbi:hypothetical protein Bca52824_032901 [Brassica carinata]|uniref:Uncharacterized protein n=1 Tax=Brassica carinata TaxID=52824 RepID=A0A8X7SCX2_BRACI|nr:hypothetical protein Bca52824_032901 [Brassica carinata]